MEKMKLYLSLIFIFFVFVLISCDRSKNDIEYYPESDIIKETRYYPNVKNDSLFFVTDYYKNKQIESKGWVKDYKNQGEWLGYYSDGIIRETMFYKDGIPCYQSLLRTEPKVILSDSLVVDKTVDIKISNLYPDENCIITGNTIIGFLENDSPFDYTLTPKDTGIITIQTELLIPIKVDASCIKNLYKENIILTDESDKNNTKISKKQTITTLA